LNATVLMLIYGRANLEDSWAKAERRLGRKVNNALEELPATAAASALTVSQKAVPDQPRETDNKTHMRGQCADTKHDAQRLQIRSVRHHEHIEHVRQRRDE